MAIRWFVYGAIFSLSLLISGCMGLGTGGGEPDSDKVDRPAFKDGVISVEGEETPVNSTLLETPADWPVSFTTYIPEEFLAETTILDNGYYSALFIANFGGSRSENAYIQALFYPEGTTEDEARTLVEGMVEILELEEEGTVEILELEPDDQEYDWSLAEYKNSPTGLAVNLIFGRHGDQFFYILVHYPVEYGDGFGPRVQYLLDEWRWEDTGDGL